MFLNVSVILLTRGGCLPQCILGYPPHRADTPRTRLPPKTRPPPPEQTPPPRSSACWEIRATSGRYASYWNTFLLINIGLVLNVDILCIAGYDDRFIILKGKFFLTYALSCIPTYDVCNLICHKFIIIQIKRLCSRAILLKLFHIFCCCQYSL